MPSQNRLPFEKDIAALEEMTARLEAETDGSSEGSENRRESLRRMRKELVNLLKDVYGKLTPWDTILVSRHGERPQTMDYVELIFEDFVELHGDRAFGDDRALRCGFARLGDHRVLLIGHQKGHTIPERTQC